MDKSSREDDFDPFNPKNKDESDDKKQLKSDDNINILYLTGAIIILLIIIWVMIVIFTKNNVEILDEMSKSNNQIKLATDKNL